MPSARAAAAAADAGVASGAAGRKFQLFGDGEPDSDDESADSEASGESEGGEGGVGSMVRLPDSYFASVEPHHGTFSSHCNVSHRCRCTISERLHGRDGRTAPRHHHGSELRATRRSGRRRDWRAAAIGTCSGCGCSGCGSGPQRGSKGCRGGCGGWGGCGGQEGGGWGGCAGGSRLQSRQGELPASPAFL